MSVILWLVPVGALLGVTLNLANSLADIEEDAAKGAHTLAVVLGAQGSCRACPLLITLSIILIAFLTFTHSVPAQTQVVVASLIVAGIITLALVLLFTPKSAVQAGQRYFYLVVLTCIVLAAGWLVGVLL